MSIGRYEILAREEIAGGGFDARARDRESGREVRLWAGAPGSGAPGAGRPDPAGILARLARVYHAALPRVQGTAEIEDRAALVVRPYRGRTLARRLEESTPDILESLDIARSVAAALAKAHREGVVHGSVGPSEIFLTEDGRTLLLHLGLGPLLGSRPPRAPEDLERAGRSESGDVFGLARVLVLCLLGEDPFSRENPGAATKALREGARPTEHDFPPELPQGLRRFLARAIDPDPSRRIHRAEEFSGDLGVIRASWESFQGRNPAPPSREARIPRVLAAGGAGLAILLLATLAIRSCGP